jgi:protein gp37
MAEQSAISWTDATFNPWIGCTKVSPACDHCYAESDNKRRGWVAGWGAGVPRRRTKTWGEPLKWNRKAAETGYRTRVFCASLADVFDNEVPQAWREDLWELLRQTPHLRWILLTKRIGNARKMLPADWGAGYTNAGLMATLENQEVWDRDFPKLMATPAAWRGVSAEPLLGPIYIRDGYGNTDDCGKKLDWLITGGESGPHHRPLNMDWVRDLRDQCQRLRITYHHKQNGGITGKVNGCLIDGVEHKHFPPALVA